jgi:hypothetical protein
MSSGIELTPKQESQTSELGESSVSFGRELIRALDERYLGQFIVENLVTLDKSVAKMVKKVTGRSTSAG